MKLFGETEIGKIRGVEGGKAEADVGILREAVVGFFSIMQQILWKLIDG